ncbi:MAG: hypothetical protein J6W37_01730 [Bacteroidales bacterium]|nr:hypothetical protein [Bacteroidales bacterium]
MKKYFLIAFFGMSALFADAQQWSGSTTTADTIYRNGMVQMLPNADNVPFSEWTPSALKVYSRYNSQFRGYWTSIECNGIHIGNHVPAPSNSTTIGLGTFSFYTGDPYSNQLHLTYNNQGILESNGKITTTDTIFAQNFTATNSINVPNAYFTYDKPTYLIVNDASKPNNFYTAIAGKSFFQDYVGINTTTLHSNSGFKLAVDGKSYFSDYVAIGTTNLSTTSGYKLAVDGGILCEEVKVIANVPSADYVFEKGYNLRSLGEVEAYVNENKHLPDVPSAKEFKENGYKMGDMDNLLLQKIEELTLYIIEQQKQIDELKNKLNE